MATHDTELGGLAASVDGYTVTAVQPEHQPAADTFVEFTLTGPDGQPPALAQVEDVHRHLVAYRRDLTGFQHVYPEPGEGTSWWAVLSLTPGPGTSPSSRATRSRREASPCPGPAP